MTMTMMMMMNAYLELYESVEDGLRPFTLAVVAVLLRRQAGQQRSRRRVAMSCHPGRRQRHHVDAATSRQVPPRGPASARSTTVRPHRLPPAWGQRQRHRVHPESDSDRTSRLKLRKSVKMRGWIMQGGEMRYYIFHPCMLSHGSAFSSPAFSVPAATRQQTATYLGGFLRPNPRKVSGKTFERKLMKAHSKIMRT